MDIFFQDNDRKEYLHLLKEQARRFGVHFLAYCLMTNHVHLIAIPYKPDGLARAVGEAHRRYTRMINLREGVRGFLFQGRFSSCPVDTGEYLFAAVRYVERHPVRAKIVSQPWEYPWSSAAFHAGLADYDPLVMKSPLLSEIHDWKNFLSTESDLSLRLQEKSRTGRPFGPESFFAVVEKITGRDARPGLPGRPKKNSNILA